MIPPVEWPVFKEFVDSRSLSIQWVDDGSTYWLKAFDSAFSLDCSLSKSNANDYLLDFETNYKALGNVPPVQAIKQTDGSGNTMDQVDTDNAMIVRIKAAKKGWSFWALPIEFTTSLLGGSVYCKNASGADIPGITCKIYDAEDAEITVAGLADINLLGCTKTVLDFEPTFDYELIGGSLRINSNPATDARLWIVGAPDIPAIYGGSKEFASGINLKFLAPDSTFEVDGRVTKFISYNPTTHQGKLRIIIKHDAGTNLNLQVLLHIYRS